MTTEGRMMRRVLLGILVCFWFSASAETAMDFSQAREAKRIELQGTARPEIGGRTIYSYRFIEDLYAANGGRPLWNESNRQAFLAAVPSLYADGLEPNEYVFPEIAAYLERAKQGSLDGSERLELDILLSEGLIRALYNLAYGKVDPVSLDPHFNFTRPLHRSGSEALLLEQIASGDIEGLFDMARPKHRSYVARKNGLKRYRELQSQVGWAVVPSGPVLKPGASDHRLPLLAQRLAATGDLGPGDRLAGGRTFDDTLVAALKRFQARHNLEPDGVLGPATLASLNVPVEQRIEQIRLNLERQRWYLQELTSEFIIVDISDFKVYWIKDDQIQWEQVVQVGREYTRTPVFSDEIEYLDFNPTWTIPPGIIKRTIIPGLRKDSGYLDKKGYALLTPDGTPVDPRSVDWQNLKGFPYLVRQPAGPDNALGLVKFMFPNPHFVFLHDTNHRELFDHPRRLFSSGCIRVKDPFELAERLLQDKEGWDRDRIDDVIASGVTTRVRLDQPMRIIIAYGTAAARDGQVMFKEDIYKRDPGVLAALNGEFTPRRRDG
jgi:murein L,D-transpeptidase YcbB/YkuD